MSIFCAVIKCRNLSGHEFPKEAKQRREWIAAVNRKNWMPSASSFICYDHFREDDYEEEIGYNKQGGMLRRLKNSAVPKFNNVGNSWSHTDIVSQSPPHHHDQGDEMQIDALDDVIRPPDMLCAIYSLPDANPAELDTQNSDMISGSCDNNTQILDTTDDMDSFYSRCLLCTCRPDATPHIEPELPQRVCQSCLEKLEIEPELPQRVCQSCLEKLEVTNELALCSQRARIILLQIKQQGENFDTEVEPDFIYSENEPELDSYQLATDSLAINKKHTIDINPNVIPIDQEESYFPMEQEDSDSNSSAEDQPTNEVEEPTRISITVSESTSKSGVAESPGLFGCIGEDGPVDEDFIKCSKCSQTIFKGYMDFHVSKSDVLLDVIYCSFCQLKLSSQVMDLHVSLRHTRKTYQKTPELQEKGLNRLIQCPSCPCMFYPESMQEHIADNHPPKHNPGLANKENCFYCGRMIKYCDMDQHLKSKHGANAWRRCIHCKKRVRNTDTDIEAHLFQEHHGGILLACIKCDERYAKTGKEQAHMQTFLSCKYKCPLQTCSKTFVTSSSFKDHVLFFHPKIEEEMQEEYKREIYEILGLDLETGDILEKPEETEEIPPPPSPPPPTKTKSTVTRPDHGGPVKCDICNKSVNHKWCLIRHKNKYHNMNLTFDCEECGKKYYTLGCITHHLQFVHAAKDQTCDICGGTFTKIGYRSHMKYHQSHPNGTQQRNYFYRPLDPVRCGMCNRPARNKYALLTHVNAEHLDVVKEPLPFHCEPCDKEFANYEYLMQHNYSKHWPKIVCTYCGKLITQNRMSMHLKIHEPDRGSDYKGKKRGRKPTKAVNQDSI
ncbi:hypothetical protein B566_EDAN016104 [Ephemera danica]|nr:hypothetical protein B566_EDAN016104 [Ephemera danica]